MAQAIDFFAAWSRSKTVLGESTSGGAFSELAKVILAEGGIVVGVAYGDNLSVEYRIANSLDELKPLCGVKYVHCCISKSIFADMAIALAAGRSVMFVGTPCLAAAVRKKFCEAKGLVVCDLVCFGAPAQEIWLKYVRWLEKCSGKRLVSVCPRDKKNGWGRECVCRYVWADGSTTRRKSMFDPYAQIFYSTLGFREVCFRCQFRGFNRVSDITLCDMWSAHELGLPNDILRRGVSGIIIHSKVGRKLFEKVDMERIHVDEVQMLRGNPCILESAEKPERRDEFLLDTKELPFDELVHKYHLRATWFDYVALLIRRGLARVVHMTKCVCLRLVAHRS